MSISDQKLKHGYVIAQIVLEASKSSDSRVNISDCITRSAYAVTVYNKGRLAGKFGLFIKYSAARRSPWRYSFITDHQTEIDLLFEEYGQVFVVLVNNDDGVACLSYELLKQILDDNHEEKEWVAVRSQLGSQYRLSGKDGRLDKKIARSDFPRSIGLYICSLVKKLDSEGHNPRERGIWKRLFGH